jgi:hypothetical protein
MRRPFFPALSALLLAFFIASCDHAPQIPTGPTIEPVYHTVHSEDGQEYTMVEDRLPRSLDGLSLSRLIGPDGGHISLVGHRLDVPAGAVELPTLFTLELITDGHIEVRLRAVRQLLDPVLGTVIGTKNIGKEGFKEPVTLSLTYARARNIDTNNPPELLIMRMLGETHADPHEPLESETSTTRKIVLTDLGEFSRFCMAAN